MSDPDYRFDRQAGEAPLRMDDHRLRRSRGPAPVTLIVSLLLLVGVGGGVLYMYRSGVKSGDAASRPLGTPLGDVRGPAPAGAPAQDAASGLSISRDDGGAGSSVPTLAAPPEEPMPPAAASVPGPSAAPASPSAGAAAPATAAPAQTAPGAAVTAPPPPPPKETASSAPVHRPPVHPDAHPKSIDQLLAQSDAAPSDRAKGDKPKADKAKAERIAADKARPAKAEPDAREAGGPVLIQIGAFSSERLADEEWSKAAAISPGAMAGKGKRVVPVAKDGATLYRTSITGFSSRDQAMALCDRLRASGGHCFVH